MARVASPRRKEARVNIDQKADALNALGGILGGLRLFRTTNCAWGCSVDRADVKEREDSCVIGSLVGFGATVDAAVAACWERATAPGHIVVLDAFKDTRRRVAWRGFMWVDLPKEPA